MKHCSQRWGLIHQKCSKNQLLVCWNLHRAHSHLPVAGNCVPPDIPKILIQTVSPCDPRDCDPPDWEAPYCAAWWGNLSSSNSVIVQLDSFFYTGSLCTCIISYIINVVSRTQVLLTKISQTCQDVRDIKKRKKQLVFHQTSNTFEHATSYSSPPIHNSPHSSTGGGGARDDNAKKSSSSTLSSPGGTHNLDIPAHRDPTSPAPDPAPTSRLPSPDTGGEGSFTQWVHCEFVVSFEAIRPVITQQECGEFF